MSVPLHWNGAGLPVGMQFVARFGHEATLFRLALLPPTRDTSRAFAATPKILRAHFAN